MIHTIIERLLNLFGYTWADPDLLILEDRDLRFPFHPWKLVESKTHDEPLGVRFQTVEDARHAAEAAGRRIAW